MRVSNIHIYNIILDSVGRTGIQISGGDSGVNEINNCHVTRTGFEFNPTQGSGIILGGYTEGYVHDNYIRNTYQHGISLLGAGLMRVENNDIDSSGYLGGMSNPDYSSISADTRETINEGATPKGIYSTVYVRNNKVGVSTNRTGTKTAYRSIDIGYGYFNLPTWNNNNIICGNVLQDGKTPAEFRINPNIGYTTNCSGTPPPPAANPIPGKIEAVSFSAMKGVQTQPTTDAGGGLNVGYIDNGDYMDYSVTVAAAGRYTASFRIATVAAGSSLQVLSSAGAVLATMSLPNTGGYQSWQTVATALTLPAGSQVLRIKSTSAGAWNINWMNFTTGYPVPGKIEAENFSAVSAGVQAQATTDAGGGLNLGWIYSGDYMDYSVNVATTGQYKVSFRVAAPGVGASLLLLTSAGAVLTSLNLPKTGGYQTWQTVSATISLNSGIQILRLKSTSGSAWNINWLQFDNATQASAIDPSDASGRGLVLDGPEVLNIYPNPVGSRFSLQVNNSLTGPMRVQLLDMAGVIRQTVDCQKTGTAFQVDINTASLATGVYIVRIQLGDRMEVRKIIKL
jgi:hypothetical protein